MLSLKNLSFTYITWIPTFTTFRKAWKFSPAGYNLGKIRQLWRRFCSCIYWRMMEGGKSPQTHTLMDGRTMPFIWEKHFKKAIKHLSSAIKSQPPAACLKSVSTVWDLLTPLSAGNRANSSLHNLLKSSRFLLGKSKPYRQLIQRQPN